jgi:cytosine/adenosine deaminase-related metal-dependent hydrolase
MSRILIRPEAIVTMDAERRFIRGGAIVINNSFIEAVITDAQAHQLEGFDGEVVDAIGLVAIPGFIQTHLHLCQTLFRGLADDLDLLDWLRLRIFPYEAAHNAQSMRTSALAGISELIRCGTTTIMDMGSVHYEEELIQALVDSGLRAFVGKSMMDRNDQYPRLKESTAVALESTRRLAEECHGASNGKIRYAVAPRFVLSCSEGLLKEAYDMTRSFPGMLFHTHAAESQREMDAVRAHSGMDNVEYFSSLDILHENTCLAHCVWVSDREIELLAGRKAKVLHCPSSNLKLGSGVANVPEFVTKGITVSLGADGAPCNNTLSIFEEMRLAAVVQKPIHGAKVMTAEQVFEMATVGGAATLGCERELGSIEVGKKADLVLLDLRRVWNCFDDVSAARVYSTIVYSGAPANVHSVMVDGAWLMQEFELTRIDEEELVAKAKGELRRLLDRVEY